MNIIDSYTFKDFEKMIDDFSLLTGFNTFNHSYINDGYKTNINHIIIDMHHKTYAVYIHINRRYYLEIKSKIKVKKDEIKYIEVFLNVRERPKYNLVDYQGYIKFRKIEDLTASAIVNYINEFDIEQYTEFIQFKEYFKRSIKINNIKKAII